MQTSSGSRTINDLLQPLGGLFGTVARFPAQSGEPKVLTTVVKMGDVSQVLPHAPQGPTRRFFRAPSAGTGSGHDDATCMVKALAEGLERYCASVYDQNQCVVATASELGREALDLDLIPKCSKAELSHARCPLIAPNKTQPIRWIRALSLLDGRAVYVPVVMVYLTAGYINRAERISLSISTGCATHTSYERALVGGILEVVERDAISLTWLQMLSLPRIEIDTVSPALVKNWECYQQSMKDLEYVFFDATTDLGIPTVYGLQIARRSKQHAVFVACSTDLDPSRAVAKVMCDMSSLKVAYRVPRRAPEDLDEFSDIFHGATYMASAKRTGAFDFLLRSEKRHFLSKIAPLSYGSEALTLRAVLDRFRDRQIDVLAVDLSTEEALRSGMRVVRVLIPDLQPMSLHYRARYLAHPRLYAGPRLMGYPVHGEDDLNKFPQPFA